MDAYADLRMPAHYVDMSEKEMEYDGGFGFFTRICISVVTDIIAPCAISQLNKAGIIDNNSAKIANTVLSVGSIAFGAKGIFTAGKALAKVGAEKTTWELAKNGFSGWGQICHGVGSTTYSFAGLFR